MRRKEMGKDEGRRRRGGEGGGTKEDKRYGPEDVGSRQLREEKT